MGRDDDLRQLQSGYEYAQSIEQWLNLQAMTFGAFENLGETPNTFYDNAAAKEMRSNASQLWEELKIKGIVLPNVHVEIGSNLHPYVKDIGVQVVNPDHTIILSDPVYQHLPTINQVTNALSGANLILDKEGLPLLQIPESQKPYNLYLFAAMNYVDMAHIAELAKGAQSIWFADEPDRGYGRKHEFGYNNPNQFEDILNAEGFIPYKPYVENGIAIGGIYLRSEAA